MLDCDWCDREKSRLMEVAVAAGETGAGCSVNSDVKLRR